MAGGILQKIYSLFGIKSPETTKTGEPLPITKEIALDLQATNTHNVTPGSISASDRDIDSHNYNPDTLVDRKGLVVYDYMLTDDQVSANSQLKKVARLATDFSIQSATSNLKDEKVAEFVRWSLTENMQGSLRTLLYNFLSAMDFGFALAEKNYEYITEGKWKGYVSYRSIAPKDPHGFLFDRDAHGNLLPDGIIQDLNEFSISNIEELRENPRYPVDKFVLFSYMELFQNPYGRSDLRPGYRSWISKDILMKYWSIYLERAGSPLPMAKIPAGASADEITDIRNVLRGLQTRSVITYPDGFDVAYLEAERTAAPGFQDAVAIHNGALSRSSNVPDLMGFSGGQSSSGGYGLGKMQYDVFIMYEENLGLTIEEMFYKQIIKPLVDMNFKNVENYPRFKFASIKRETRMERAQILETLVKTGVIDEFQPWMIDFTDLPVPQSQYPKSGKSLSLQKGQPAVDNNRGMRRDPKERTISDDTNPNIGKDNDND